MISVRVKAIKGNQSGLASILVAGIFIALLTLVVTSFALLMRQEQRQALDRQLSTQAYYAAESGVNDAIKALQIDPNIPNTNDCSETGTVTGGKKLDDQNTGVTYTCVLLDKTPGTLEYSPTSTEKSTIVKITASEEINSINLSWEPLTDISDTGYVENSGHPLPMSNSIGDTSNQVRAAGVLRTSLIPIKPPISREQLINETQTLYLYGKKSDTAGQFGTHAYAPGVPGQGVFVDGECNAGSLPNDCNMTINGLSGTNTYYLRLKSIYAQHKVVISANGNNGRVEFSNSQAVIDATGKANDVIRRIQVRVPLNSDFNYPEYALETTDSICKRFQYSLPSVNHPQGGPTTDACQ